MPRLAQIQTKFLPEVPLAFGPPLNDLEFLAIREHLGLHCFKWDYQVGDSCTLFRQPLLMRRETWIELAQLAENLERELLMAERELLHRPELQEKLGLPLPIKRILASNERAQTNVGPVRTLRFDFHYTPGGWCVSEVNSDVPGGYTEASCFPQLMSRHYAGVRPAGNPIEHWTNLVTEFIGCGKIVAFLSAAGFLEDQQVTAFLASHLQHFGLTTFLLHHPSQLRWHKSSAFALDSSGRHVPVDLVVRFYQGEWLSQLNATSGWQNLFTEVKTPVINPGFALLAESKRLPLIWDQLSVSIPNWKKLLPECREVGDCDWERSSDWVMKACLANNGDSVYMHSHFSDSEWRNLCSKIKRHPERWVAQRKFDVVPIQTAAGEVFPCIGVYTINGEACGAYVRASRNKIIDYAACDVALLVQD